MLLPASSRDQTRPVARVDNAAVLESVISFWANVGLTAETVPASSALCRLSGSMKRAPIAPNCAPVMFASLRFAFVRIVPCRLALIIEAPERSALARPRPSSTALSNTALFKLIPVRLLLLSPASFAPVAFKPSRFDGKSGIVALVRSIQRQFSPSIANGIVEPRRIVGLVLVPCNVGGDRKAQAQVQRFSAAQRFRLRC